MSAQLCNQTTTLHGSKRETARVTTSAGSSHSTAIQPEQERDDPLLVATEAINICLIFLATWMLLSVLVYGTKTGRWRKSPGNSSLNSGATYVACAAFTAFSVAKLTATEILYRVQDESMCKAAVDVVAACYFVSLYTAYLFMWILQRKIYKHPCVKKRVRTCIDRFSRVFLLVFVAQFLSLMVLNYVIPYTLVLGLRGCVQCTGDHVQVTMVLILLVALATQATNVMLFAYPAYRARFSTQPSNEARPIEHLSPEHNPPVYSDSCCRRCCASFSASHVSPIEMTVKRAVLGSVTIALSDLVALVVDVTALQNGSDPAVYRFVGHNISSVLNVFCMLGIFGFATQVLTVLLPNCRRAVPQKTRASSPGSDLQVRRGQATLEFPDAI